MNSAECKQLSGFFSWPDGPCWIFWRSTAVPSAWEDLESSGPTSIHAKRGRTSAKEKHETVITVWCSARLCTLSCKQIKSRILSLVWVEVQDLDFYKYPADS